MSEIKLEIFKELDKLEDAAANVISAKKNSGKQVDLETAILTRQVQALKAANVRANTYINETVAILKKLKKVPK
ncbi:MAG: hypothetical protein FWD33_03640 [Alphaproteobacteria bacterium]|nr:hypothetical protein [Alphaproteobacteria bacterium]